MPPKSTSKAPVDAPVSGTRKSTRSAPQSAAKKEEEKKATNSKKRSADEPAPKSATASKKAKATSTPKSQPKSTTKATPKSQPKSKSAAAKPAAANGTNGTSSKKEKPAVEDKKAEKEKEEEADAGEAPDADGPILKEGEKLPGIKLQNEEGKEVDVAKLAGKNGVVMFLYPKADTPGCTSQACGFRDHFDDIKKLGYEIYGLSKDSPNAQKKWKDKKELNYHLLCDPDMKLIKRLGAFVAPKNTKRSHFIFEKGSGKLVEIALGVKPADDPSNVLKFIKAHHK